MVTSSWAQLASRFQRRRYGADAGAAFFALAREWRQWLLGRRLAAATSQEWPYQTVSHRCPSTQREGRTETKRGVLEGCNRRCNRHDRESRHGPASAAP